MTAEEIEKILSKVSCIPLCTYDTPLERMERVEKEMGLGPLYIKRDDLNGVGPGGNKVRPLEYLLGDAISKKCDIVIASGQKNSNLCSITAAACAKIGMKCILVHNNRKPENGMKNLYGNALLNGLSNAEEYYIGDVTEQKREAYIEDLAKELRQKGKNPYIIKNGATSPEGAIGYIHFAIELQKENKIQSLFVPGGNGGLAAGTIFGTALLENPFHIHVITVENATCELERIIVDLVEKIEQILGVCLPIPISEVMTIHDGYQGEGWGIPAQEADKTIKCIAGLEGIYLDRTYTGKTAWGMLDLLKTGSISSQGACLLHSGGFASIFDQYR